MNIQALPYISFLGLMFGSSLLASRFSVEQIGPMSYLGLRLVIASLAHIVVYTFLSRRHWPRDRQLWRRAAPMGILGTAVPMTAVINSLQFQSAGVTALLLTTGPAVTVIFAHFILPDETLSRRKVIGVVLALGGAVLLAIRGENGLADGDAANPLGYGLVLTAIVLNSAMTIYARRYLRTYDSFDVASIRMFAAMLTITPLTLLFLDFDLSALDGSGYFAVFYGALVGTFFGLILAFYNIKRFGATASVMVAYIIPIVAGIGGVLVLDETFTVTMLLGMAVIIAGIAILQQRVAQAHGDAPARVVATGD